MEISEENRKIFEKNQTEIERVIGLNVGKWKLQGAIPSMDRDDVAQMIRQHIIIKIHLFDENRDIGRWLSTVVCNFLKNLVRNNYYKLAKPCVSEKCSAYLGGEDCKIYTHTCSECPLYAKWEKDKKQQSDVKLPVSLENDNRMTKLSEIPFDDSSILDKIEELKFKLKSKLTPNEFYIFNAMYLENKTDADILKGLKFSSKAEGNRQIRALKLSIYEIVKKTILEEDLI